LDESPKLVTNLNLISIENASLRIDPARIRFDPKDELSDCQLISNVATSGAPILLAIPKRWPPLLLKNPEFPVMPIRYERPLVRRPRRQ